MELHILPVHRGNPPIPIPMTPYVALERYDGGPWLSYPVRKGMAITVANGTPFNLFEYLRAERVNPTPIRKQEAFLQTWLYFGLIAEFMCCNADFPLSSQNPLIDEIYDKTLVKNGDATYVRLDGACLDDFFAKERTRVPADVKAGIARYNHLITCLKNVYPIISRADKDFNSAIRWSIAALGDVLTHKVNLSLDHLQIPRTFERNWGLGLLDHECRKSMMDSGWCPSDISRIESKYQSVQTFYLARMMDKSLPRRDHSKCTNSSCNTHPINSSEGVSQHKLAHCARTCQELVVKEEALTPALFTKDHFPLLNLKGGLEDLDCEIVESGGRPYVAISHVWADGLGNPVANSLHKCKLHHLRGLVERLQETARTNAKANIAQSIEPYLIWLDTLCCPARAGEGKTMAIMKIRNVYREAEHVLVLDAGLMSYEAGPQQPAELLVRIFTCGWMRRLWTLQEGALAKSLYFQFADDAVSLSHLFALLLKKPLSATHRAVYCDMIRELYGLEAFFYDHEPWSAVKTMHFLDRSLQYRGVTVPSDEPLCIAVLLSLDLPAVLEHQAQQDRMQKVWELMSSKMGGIQSSIIFLQGQNLTSKGWRWAPKSLLTPNFGVFALDTRLMRWKDKQLGLRTRVGLRVQYPGYEVKFEENYGDGLPRNPWPGMPRMGEESILFKDTQSATWYRVVDSQYSALSQGWTEEEQQEYRDKNLVPLHDKIDLGRAVLISNPDPGGEGLLATVISEDSNGGGLAVTNTVHVLTQALGEEGHIYDTIKDISLRLRAEDLTVKHMKLFEVRNDKGPDPHDLEDGQEGSNTSATTMKPLADVDAEELKASILGLKNRMKEMMAHVVRTDENFVKAVDTFYGPSFREYIWVLVTDFFNHDYSGKATATDQVWFVD